MIQQSTFSKTTRKQVQMLNMDQHCNFFGQRSTLNEDFFLKYIDIAMDYAGSFDREKVIDYMVINHDSRCQGAGEDATKTILDNNDKVEQNCLTYMETIDDMSTWSKIYIYIYRYI